MHLKLISQSLAFIKHKINKFLLELCVHCVNASSKKKLFRNKIQMKAKNNNKGS